MQPGECIDGKYEIRRPIGRGAMGEVYEATHLVLKQPVAVKVLNAKYAENERAVRRFIREAQAATAIGSEHIVRVTDGGVLPDGSPYLVMELLDGSDLKQSLAEQGLFEPWRAIGLITQACSALQIAHERNIIHRDLKPANLFVVRRSDGSEWVKIVDFGVAKVQKAAGEDSMTLTDDGATLGTPLYMSLEQARGSADVDGRADVYSLGVIFYEMVTGRLPYRGDTFANQLVLLATEEPPPPRSLRPEIHEGLERVMLWALARNPDERCPSMEELARVLANHEEQGETLPFFGHAAQPGPPGLDLHATEAPSPEATRPGHEGLAGAPPIAAPTLGEPTVDGARSAPAATPSPPVREPAPPPRRALRWLFLLIPILVVPFLIAGVVALAYFGLGAKGPGARAPRGVMPRAGVSKVQPPPAPLPAPVPVASPPPAKTAEPRPGEVLIGAAAVKAEADLANHVGPFVPFAFDKMVSTEGIDEGGAPSKGSPGASIVIYGFNDFESPPSHPAHSSFTDAYERHQDQVRLVHFQFPIDQACMPDMTRPLHLVACKAAQVAVCAQEQNRYWEYAALLHKSRQIIIEEDIREAAEGVGLDQERLETCMASGRARERVLHDIAQGVKLGVDQVPLFIINGRAVPGDPGRRWEVMIRHLVKNNGQW